MKTARRAATAFLLASIFCLPSISPALAGKPGGGGASSDPQVAYRLPDGKGTKLVVSTEAGANQMTLYRSATSFDFDLAPRSQKQIAIVDGTQANASLKLLTYSVNSAGVYVQSSVQTLTTARRGSTADFSPDGTKIAYACCWDGTNEKLAVYDLIDGSITYWATQPFFWGLTWYRGGSSIAYSSERDLYEVTAPNAAPQHLFGTSGGQVDIDSARTDPDTLVVSYNDTAGNARVGLWKNGSFLNADLANSARSWRGTLNCEDNKLAYLGVQNTSGSQAFYVRDLNTGIVTLTSKNSNILLQFWPTCS